MKKIMFWIAIILVGITIFLRSQAGREYRTRLSLSQYALQEADMPSGWERTHHDTYSNPDGSGYSYTVTYQTSVYEPAHTYSSIIDQQITVLSSADQAQVEYESQDHWFDRGGVFNHFHLLYSDYEYTLVRQTITSFSPSDPNDDYWYECIQTQPYHPELVCLYMQRHNNLVNTVTIRLDRRLINNPSEKAIDDILRTLDKRLIEFSIYQQKLERTTLQ